MEELLGFAAAVIIISTSGVMLPGPLFVANIFYGAKEGASAGLKMSYGHTVVELPLIILLGFSALSLETIPQFRIIIAILGSIGLFLFAGIQIKSVFYYLVVYHRLQINFRFTIFVVILGDCNIVCITYMDGLCMVNINCIFIISWLEIFIKQKL